jgi:hypothetical protein
VIVISPDSRAHTTRCLSAIATSPGSIDNAVTRRGARPLALLGSLAPDVKQSYAEAMAADSPDSLASYSGSPPCCSAKALKVPTPVLVPWFDLWFPPPVFCSIQPRLACSARLQPKNKQDSLLALSTNPKRAIAPDFLAHEQEFLYEPARSRAHEPAPGCSTATSKSRRQKTIIFHESSTSWATS